MDTTLIPTVPNSGADPPPSERSVHELWAAEKSAFLANPDAASKLVKRANREGEHLLAIEISDAALETTPTESSAGILQQRGRALAALGFTQDARTVLERIPLGSLSDPETLGLLGRVFKDMAAAAQPSARPEFLREALQRYQHGFERARQLNDAPGAQYCGVNAASMAALLGDDDLARRLADEALQYSRGGDYYSVASRAEAALILRREDEACADYRRAAKMAEEKREWADMASTRKQCRTLSAKLYARRDKFDDCFPASSVAIFSGHMIDRPGRPVPRFPASSESSVKERISAWIQASAARLSFSSAACGSDILFLEAALENGVKPHIVLPFAPAEFIECSVRPGGEGWVTRFERTMNAAKSVTVLNDQVADDQSSVFEFTNRMIAARAKLQAQALGFPVTALAVWNGNAGDGGGGSSDAVRCWCRAKIRTFVIHPQRTEPAAAVPPDLREEIAAGTAPFDRIKTALTGNSPMKVKTDVCFILHFYFADYFSFKERQYAAFEEKLLGNMARTLAETRFAPVSRYGLGPDYIFVFDSARAAGECARELIEAADRAMKEDEDLKMEMPRVCLHAGPVQLMVNPVLNQYSHEGATLTRAGRIVRRVTPAVPYCTDAFASLAALDEVRGFQFDFAGISKYEDDAEDRLFRMRFQ